MLLAFISIHMYVCIEEVYVGDCNIPNKIPATLGHSRAGHGRMMRRIFVMILKKSTPL